MTKNPFEEDEISRDEDDMNYGEYEPDIDDIAAEIIDKSENVESMQERCQHCKNYDFDMEQCIVTTCDFQSVDVPEDENDT